MKIDYNECWYSCGAVNPHDACLHQKYCIFNSNRERLESMICELENELNNIETQIDQVHSINTAKNYDDLKKEKTLLLSDLEDLRIFRMMIIDKGVEEYGYGVLES